MTARRSWPAIAPASPHIAEAAAIGRQSERSLGLPNGQEHGRRRRRIAAVGKQAGGDYGGDRNLAALTALADDRELCRPQPDNNLTATCHSGFLPIGGPSAGWLHSF